MTYASSDNLEIILASMLDSVNSDLLTYAISISDAWVDSKIKSVPVSPSVPILIGTAAEYFSAAYILRNLYDTDSEESNTAIWYETQANSLLDAYLAQNPDTEDFDSPYSSSLTPTRVFSKRDVRTVYDDDDEKGIDDNDWSAE